MPHQSDLMNPYREQSVTKDTWVWWMALVIWKWKCYVDKSLKDIKKKLTENRYHVNRNRNGEKQAFFRKYNTTAWQELPSEEKAMHAARACQACMPSCLLHILDFTKNPTPTPTPTSPRICLETSINKPGKVLEFKAFLISLVQNQIW